jgi:hypothetical protein
MGLALISRKILRAKEINKKEHREDKLALEANICYDDIKWSFKKIMLGKYIASGKKLKKFLRVYKYGHFNEFHIKNKKMMIFDFFNQCTVPRL